MRGRFTPEVEATSGDRALGPIGLFGRLGRPAVFRDPFAAETKRLVRGQPGPIGTARPQRDPYSFAVYVLFNREGRWLRHRKALIGDKVVGFGGGRDDRNLSGSVRANHWVESTS